MLFVFFVVFRGLGAFIVFGLGALALLVTGAVTSAAHLNQRVEGFVGSVLFVFAGLMTWALGDWLNHRTGVDPDTGQRVVTYQVGHSLFYLPVEMWGIIMVGLGILLAIVTVAASLQGNAV